MLSRLFRYGGIFERGAREYTLDDFYSIQLDKLDKYTPLKRSDIVISAGDDESSEDDDDDEDDEDEGDDDDDDQTLVSRSPSPAGKKLIELDPVEEIAELEQPTIDKVNTCKQL